MTWKMTARDVAEIGVMSATLTAGKTVMSFLPNIEIVSFLIIMYAMYFGRKVFLSIFVFVAVECMIWGFNIWTVMYLYIWPLLAGITLLLKNHNSVMFWALVSAVFGLAFGGLCSLVYVFSGGFKTAFAWWIAGIPMDVAHCVGNFAVMLSLYKPIRTVMDKIKDMV